MHYSTQGFLGFNEFVLAMQIISLAHSENEITANILKNTDLENISPPAMEGLDEMISTGRCSPIKKGHIQMANRLEHRWSHLSGTIYPP